MDALETARVVFIDDIHPQGDPAQVQIVLHLLERRYELGRAGTSLTTNLQTSQLGVVTRCWGVACCHAVRRRC